MRRRKKNKKFSRHNRHRIQGHRVFCLDGKIPKASRRPVIGRDGYDILDVMDMETGFWVGSFIIPNKGYEQTLAREALKLTGLFEGEILTFDAGITTKENLQFIADMGLNYICAMKSNNGKVYHLTRDLFDAVDERASVQATLGPGVKVASVLGDESKFSEWTEREKRNGQREFRTYQTYMSTDFLPEEVRAQYPSVAGVGRARRVVYKKTFLKEERCEFWERSVEEVLYLISLECTCREFAHVARGEWTVESTGHYVQDWSFMEDHFKAKREEVQANFAVFRRLAQNLLTFYRYVTGQLEVNFPELIQTIAKHPLLAVQLTLGEFENPSDGEDFIRANARDYTRQFLESLPGFESPQKAEALDMVIDEVKKIRDSFG